MCIQSVNLIKIRSLIRSHIGYTHFSSDLRERIKGSNFSWIVLSVYTHGINKIGVIQLTYFGDLYLWVAVRLPA